MKRPINQGFLKKSLFTFGTVFLLLIPACAVTPHANIGMDLNYYNGSFHLQPSAHVGLSGYPRR